MWIVDPVDGTREFSEPGRTDWAVHVALAIDGVAVVGAVALPARGITLSTDPPPPRARRTMRRSASSCHGADRRTRRGWSRRRWAAGSCRWARPARRPWPSCSAKRFPIATWRWLKDCFRRPSTDVDNLSAVGPMKDLPLTMSKMLNLGMSLSDVVTAVTSRPASVIGRQSEIGAIAIGREADLALFELVEEPVESRDAYGHTRKLDHWIKVTDTIRKGVPWNGPFPHPGPSI